MNISAPGTRPEIKKVKIHDSFWSPLIEKFRKVTLPDVINKFFSSEYGDMRDNFKYLIRSSAKHIGTAWHDGLIYEVITAASDFLASCPEPEMEKQLDDLIELICDAQKAVGDGYISTFTLAVAPGNRFGTHGGNALVQHDLYNLGCLIEAGVHHYKAVGKDRLLLSAVNAAEYLCDTIGYAPKLNIVPGHSMIEFTVTELYELIHGEPELKEKLSRLTGRDIDEKRYLELSLFFLENRGRHEDRANCPANLTGYAQDHRPLTEQDEAVGHAVRAMLLYEGLTGCARITGNPDYLMTAKKLWENVTEKKLHISGGVGAMSFQENFGYQYQLPENAYLETCAGAALVFWAAEMGRLEDSGEYYDVLERALYNNVLSGVSESGTEYFYQNPLVSNGDIERWDWHECPCCPPMLLKVIASLGRYIYTVGKDTVRIDMHIGSEIDLGLYTVIQDEDKIIYHSDKSRRLKLLIRIPEYQFNPSFKLNGMSLSPETDKGYAVIDRIFDDGDTIEYHAEEPVLSIQAHPYSDEVYGKIAFQKGRFLLCAEGCDNDGSVKRSIPVPPAVKESEDKVLVTSDNEFNVTLIPYYTWNNRGKDKMAVWFAAPGLRCSKFELEGWKNRLYKLTPPSDTVYGR